MTIKEDKKVKKNKISKKKVGIKKYANLEGKFLLVKVGTKEDPATQEDIIGVQNTLINLLEVNDVNCLALVSGLDIDMKIVEDPPDETDIN